MIERTSGLGRADRLQLRADGIYARLGGFDEDGYVWKAKGMRWRTFNRLMEKAGDLAGEADAGFALRILSRFGHHM